MAATPAFQHGGERKTFRPFLACSPGLAACPHAMHWLAVLWQQKQQHCLHCITHLFMPKQLLPSQEQKLPSKEAWLAGMAWHAHPATAKILSLPVTFYQPDRHCIHKKAYLCMPVAGGVVCGRCAVGCHCAHARDSACACEPFTFYSPVLLLINRHDTYLLSILKDLSFHNWQQGNFSILLSTERWNTHTALHPTSLQTFSILSFWELFCLLSSCILLWATCLLFGVTSCNHACNFHAYTPHSFLSLCQEWVGQDGGCAAAGQLLRAPSLWWHTHLWRKLTHTQHTACWLPSHHPACTWSGLPLVAALYMHTKFEAPLLCLHLPAHVCLSFSSSVGTHCRGTFPVSLHHPTYQTDNYIISLSSFWHFKTNNTLLARTCTAFLPFHGVKPAWRWHAFSSHWKTPWQRLADSHTS